VRCLPENKLRQGKGHPRRSVLSVLVGCLLVFVLATVKTGSLLAAADVQVQENGNVLQFLTAIQEKAAGVASFSCSFQQTRHMAMFAKPVKFSGRLVVAKPDKLRWEFLAPIPSALLFNGNAGLRCNDQAPPVSFDLQSDPVMHVVAQQLWLWLRADYAHLQEQYRLRLVGPETLEVTPLDSGMARYIGKVELLFDLTTGHPRQVTITEPGGDRTEIVFASYILNPQLSQAIFAACDNDAQ